MLTQICYFTYQPFCHLSLHFVSYLKHTKETSNITASKTNSGNYFKMKMKTQHAKSEADGFSSPSIHMDEYSLHF